MSGAQETASESLADETMKNITETANGNVVLGASLGAELTICLRVSTRIQHIFPQDHAYMRGAYAYHTFAFAHSLHYHRGR